MNRKFSMDRNEQVEAFVETGSTEGEMTTRLTFHLPESLKHKFDVEAATKKIKKGQLAREIFEEDTLVGEKRSKSI